MLLSVDAGLKAGLALLGPDGRLVWHRSHNFGRSARLRRGVRTILGSIAGLSALVVEGGGPLADVWLRAGERMGLTILQVSAEQWRQAMLIPRKRKSGPVAKDAAGVAARAVIGWSGLKGPTALRHDAAEAVLAGVYGGVLLGLFDPPPREVLSFQRI